MILQALNSYYERLQADPNADVAPFGYSRQKISFCVVLNDDGSLHEIIPETDGDSAKPQPKLLIVTGGAKPSGSGINPGFLWDNTGYMLGFKPDDDKPERTLQTFEAFRQKHLDLKQAIDDPEFQAVCHFLSQWEPTEAGQYQTLTETSTGFGVFRLRGQTHYVHEREAIRNWWDHQLTGTDPDTASKVVGQCLLTGHSAPLARLHEPKIKGVAGAQSAGASLVSFNENAYESFGRSQSYNAPVSEAAAFQYGTALNQLLRSEHGRRIQIGDATTVFWTESPSPLEDVFGCIVDPGRVPAEDEAQKNQLRNLLQRIASGEDVSSLEIGDADTPFYVLGLSPNAARLSVRFWYVCTLKDLAAALRQHFQDLEIVRGDRDPEFPAVWQLLRETARESKDIPPLLSGAVMRSILTRSAYPQMLFAAVIRRIRADRDVNSVRVALLKACLIRQGDRSDGCSPKPFMDEGLKKPAYLLGRLFGSLESCQVRSRPKASKRRYENTIRHRYLSSAMGTPQAVFVQLLKLGVAHISKVAKQQKSDEKSGRGPLADVRANAEQMYVTNMLDCISELPTHLNLDQQAWFLLGYYQQSQHNLGNRPEDLSSSKGKTLMVEQRGANELHESPAYHAGRLLAVCQQIQDLADPDVGTTYVDSYFSAASTNPTILSRVWKIARHRLKQITHRGTRRELEDLATRIVVRFKDGWPQFNTIHDQGLFQLGYFQQRAYLPHSDFRKPYLANDGQAVKSYGEKLVADTLLDLGIAYEYETQIMAPDEREASGQRAMDPDFTVHSLDGKRTLYIEYCGLRGVANYDRSWSAKARNYRHMKARTISEIATDGQVAELALLELAPEHVRDAQNVRNLILEAVELALGDAKPHPAAEMTPF